MTAANRILATIFAATPCLLAAGPDTTSPDEPLPPPRVVELRFFYQPGCDECAHITNHVLPQAVMQFADMVAIAFLPVDIASNRAVLLDAMNRAGDTSNERVYMDVDRRHLLSGADTIEQQLLDTINLAMSEPPPHHDKAATDGARALAQRLTVPGVVAAGLFDSINPCAIAALIFLVSVLTLAREKPVNVLVAGLSYCLGVFLTYTAIGFGLLAALRSMQSFPTIRTAFDLALALLLLVLAALSFRDAHRARSGHSGEMTLKLPDTLSSLVRATLRSRFGAAVGLASAFLAGCLVTAIEVVCTGQVYGPTLAVIVAQQGSAFRETILLLIYNLMFVLPLLVILVLTWRGMTLSRLLSWSRRNAATTKVLMGLLFLGLLAFLILARLRA